MPHTKPHQHTCYFVSITHDLSQAFINGLPAEIDPEIWEPIVQNHFLSAGSVLVANSSSALMVSIVVRFVMQLLVLSLLPQKLAIGFELTT
jgi:hypothetical protein